MLKLLIQLLLVLPRRSSPHDPTHQEGTEKRKHIPDHILHAVEIVGYQDAALQSHRLLDHEDAMMLLPLALLMEIVCHLAVARQLEIMLHQDVSCLPPEIPGATIVLKMHSVRHHLCRPTLTQIMDASISLADTMIRTLAALTQPQKFLQGRAKGLAVVTTDKEARICLSLKAHHERHLLAELRRLVQRTIAVGVAGQTREDQLHLQERQLLQQCRLCILSVLHILRQKRVHK